MDVYLYSKCTCDFGISKHISDFASPIEKIPKWVHLCGACYLCDQPVGHNSALQGGGD